MRGDAQELDSRCGTSGASVHVTTKPSIRKLGVLYKSGVYASKATCLTPGGLYDVRLQRYGRDIVAPPGNQAGTEKTNIDLKPQVRTEGGVIHPDRHTGVSRGHSRQRRKMKV